MGPERPVWASSSPLLRWGSCRPGPTPLISGKPLLTPKSWVFRIPFSLLIYLCSQEQLAHGVLWEGLTVNKLMSVLRALEVYFYTAVSMC